MLIQESKLSSMSDSTIRGVCGSGFFDWVCLDVVGASGGILLCCNKRVLNIKDSWIGSLSVSALVEDLNNNFSWIISSVYGSKDSNVRANFWSELHYIRGRWRGPWCIGGDWNIARYPTEKMGGARSAMTCHFSRI